MSEEIRIVAVERDEPNVRLYVLALIALARELQAQDVEHEVNGD
jgi:hypothetical protein